MLALIAGVVCAMSDKNLFEKNESAAISAAEIDATIGKARAVKAISALGSRRVYQLIKRYFSPTVVGLENIPKQPTLFVGNHCLLGLDGFIVGPVLYYEANRLVRMMGDNIGVITDEWREDLLPVIPGGLFSTLLPKPQHCYLAFGEPIKVPDYCGEKTVPNTVLRKVRDEAAHRIDGLLRDMLLLRTQEKENEGFFRRLLTL
jgi:1-acyl-sn-glycerol-3-phosphate acyltransferase